ncbi:hypothetical protein MGAST_03050 [Mycobacterium gastri 'Wayne']|uniref:NAD-dependent epimerase/dehydratase domain-containing protein n=1 Tax=Mycobacterium gastri TaxID=1777 RepID=A0A1X1UUJ9_MYCGS|nr:hypothetical protein MGAST_03050 [Mycobacterium gastri 'Wayne']ORV60358.1 hypothetical protein AWC07_18265 [Mycobacterium gastri]
MFLPPLAVAAVRFSRAVSDIVDACSLVLHTPTLHGRAINFASGTDTRVKDIVQYIVEYIEDKLGATIEHRAARPGEVQRFPADISLARCIGFGISRNTPTSRTDSRACRSSSSPSRFGDYSFKGLDGGHDMS